MELEFVAMLTSLPNQTWLPEEKKTANALVSLYREYNLKGQIALYFDSDHTAVYSLDRFDEWLFIPVIDRESLLALAKREVIGLRFDSMMGLDILIFRDNLFAVVDGNFGDG